MKLRLCLTLLLAVSAFAQERWTAERAKAWYAQQPWLVGANYIPANSINQLEMWQSDSFDSVRINKELGWAANLGMNTMRVYLHDLVFHRDPQGFLDRIDEFLTIANRHGIRPIFVFFDSCWDPYPQYGQQRAPQPGIHNSGWVQSPGQKALADPSQYPRLELYVKKVVGRFANDRRILAWDLWNEPDNLNNSSYGTKETPEKLNQVSNLLWRVFQWARAAKPSQPLTAALWQGDWSSDDKMSALDRRMASESDIITFHNYDSPAEFEKRVKWLQRYGRPLICTEYMARGNGSTFQGSMPIAKKYGVGMINWGLVAGKTQTFLPWDSWKQPYINGREPSVWFHEVFRTDGTPYKEDEVAFLREITGANKKRALPKAAGQ